MSLKDWASNGWLSELAATAEDIAHLFHVAQRDLRTAKGVDDSDWTFNIAYNAVLKLATVPLYAEGYRADKMNNHYRTFQAIPLIIGKEQKASAAYLDKCRQKRNSATYDRVAVVSKKEAKELIDFAEEFKEVITTWLDEKHPELAAKVRSELKTIED